MCVLEQQLVTDKAWNLRGEVKGSARPDNSLLDLTADIERYFLPLL